MVGEINKKLGIDLFPKDGSNRIKSEEINISSNFTEENVLDLLTPNASSLAGPLVFL
ncbi:MAG: hypothetical protein LBH96_01885 [Candidatus Peribacteria bacterium]|jgi:hypothetical protein|nr:hypothetical protein [Candidatus Peribacteria bacterium]